MIERADINSVLMQMRAMKADAQQGVMDVNKLTPNMAPQPVEKTEGFGTLLKTAVDKVHETQQTASRMATAYEQGDPSVELTQVMVQLQKASVSFEAMTQVRNRLVTAYEDIMKMPV
ncbi:MULTISPECIES: flagellar hook-basal body complex protein FliE [Neptunomonas]|uniref:Flagellar hook-basal body complex protein FliE n=1 Tax=Neptunomonas marina TaxID=1815562 RepID=A0A437Q6V7_9GAMM|nr:MULTISPECIES: flagellar hook-basal body complex protein FliE [Neptunomonas]RVU30262.1 flagellar hook-basal body complex protein FliE [Neptunomonas marina]